MRFSTYATWSIRSSIQDYILRNWSMVRAGTSSAPESAVLQSPAFAGTACAGIGSPVQCRHTQGDIGGARGFGSRCGADGYSRLSGSDTSLNAPLVDDGGSTAEQSDFLISDGPLPDEIVAETIDVERRASWLKNALGVLNEREMKIIEQRRLSEEGATLEALGETLGISKERVRQIECRAMEKLKSALIKRSSGSAPSP